MRLTCVVVGLCGLLLAGQAQPQTQHMHRPANITWQHLSASQQAALGPLSTQWNAVAKEQQRKWLSVADSFSKLSPAQQKTLHARMAEWAALSPQQRLNARHNFAINRELTDGLTPEQRQAQWQAYQQLSPEQRAKLAQSAPKPVKPGGAPASGPQPVLKKEPPPQFGSAKALAKAQSAPPSPPAGQKILIPPHLVEQGSVLPNTAKSASN